MHLIASGWYHSGLSCDAQTALILYAIPLTGDALQFIIIDKLQAAAQCRAHTVHTPCTHSARTVRTPCTHHAHAIAAQAFGFIARAVDASRDFEDLEEGGTAECDTCLIARSDAP